MVQYIIGRQNTGKSIYYEKLIEKQDNIFYFATLQRTPDTEQTIHRHRIRRSDQWIVSESVGVLRQDQATIEAVLDRGHTPPMHCMIDGLTNWCMYCAAPQRNYLETAEQVSHTLLALFTKYNDCHWYLLDNLKSDFAVVPVRAMMWQTMYDYLSGMADLEIVNWEA